MIDIEKFTQVFDKAKDKSLISTDRCLVLWKKLIECGDIEGVLFECGVYKGGSAYLLKKCSQIYGIDKELYLFDTFKGMPPVNKQEDLHNENDFNDITLDLVKDFVGEDLKTHFIQGFIPDTFKDLQDIKIAFAHIDVDIYKSVWDCCEFIWSRLSVGGIIVFDDYGFDSCPGAKKAVDSFFKDIAEINKLETKQVMVKKS
jgi:O-methyltransferase